jgi:hypothetical protein
MCWLVVITKRQLYVIIVQVRWPAARPPRSSGPPAPCPKIRRRFRVVVPRLAIGALVRHHAVDHPGPDSAGLEVQQLRRSVVCACCYPS